MLASLWSHIKSNVLALVLAVVGVGAVANTGGCGLFDMSLSPRGASAQGTAPITQTNGFQTQAAIAQRAQQASDIAAVVGEVPTPAAPVATAVSNFLSSYGAELQRRLDQISQDVKADRSSLLQAQLGAFMAGLSGLFIKRKAAPAAASTPSTTGA